jgi:DNA polymerase
MRCTGRRSPQHQIARRRRLITPTRIETPGPVRGRFYIKNINRDYHIPNDLVFDAETGSRVKLGGKGSNVTVYMTDESTRVWCIAYSFNGSRPQLWRPGYPIPDVFQSADRFIAHSVEFERALWRCILPQYGFPLLPPSEKWFCTQAAARMTALPAKLENIAAILNLPRKHDPAVMLRMAKPRKPRPGEDPAGIYWNDNPADFAALYDYCIGDVLCEMALYKWILRHWDMSSSNCRSSDAAMRSVA